MNNRWIVIAVVMLTTIGCSGIRVSQDYEPSTEFSALKTFAWKSETQEKTGDPRIDNPLRDARIRAAVERVLVEKGFIQSSDEPPAFLVSYQNVLRRKIESSGTSGGVGFGVGRYGRSGTIAIGTGNEVREYEEGSMIIDFSGPESDNLLWRGTGNQRYREYDDPEKTTRDINALVEKILSQFPPTE